MRVGDRMDMVVETREDGTRAEPTIGKVLTLKTDRFSVDIRIVEVTDAKAGTFVAEVVTEPLTRH